MERSVSLLRRDDDNYYLRENRTVFRCSECRGTFQKPILATVSHSGHIETYYACPRCITKISRTKAQESEETPRSVEGVKKVVAKIEENVRCTHFLGYLKKRSKDTPIPEECLTCSKMIECLLR